MLQPNLYRFTFICRRGKNRYPIKAQDIACFFTEDRETWVITISGKEFHVQKNLDQLESELDPSLFFRANRQVICSKNAVEKFEVQPKSKIKLFPLPSPTFDIIISTEKSSFFKEWIRG